ncbi:MAG: hypothetical protein K8S98_09090 [Planctomycetes bacterium]|nr:hypothetical protein [Planctomycetota bacterium]
MSDTTSNGRRFFERWLFWPGALLLVLVGLELGYRVQRILGGKPYLDRQAKSRVALLDQENARIIHAHEESAGRVTGADDELLPHPYLGLVARGTLRTLERAVDAMREPGETRVDVVLVGGGATRIFPVARESLIDALSKTPAFADRKIVLWNFAEESTKAPQQLELLLYLTALGVAPDLVIDIAGRNEIMIGCANALADTHPVYPVRKKWEPLVFGGGTDRISIDFLVKTWTAGLEIDEIIRHLNAGGIHCALWASGAIERVETLAIDRDLALNSYRRRSEASRRQIVLRGPSPPVGPKLTLNASATAWYQATRDLGAVCAARHIRFVSVLEPFGENAVPGAEDEPDESEKIGLPHARRVLVTAASGLVAAGVTWIDAATVVPEKATPKEAALLLVAEIARRLGAP